MKSLNEHLIEDLSETITKKYKVDHSILTESIRDSIQKNNKLINLIEKENSIKDIKRTKVYKEFENHFKKKVYSDLRRYFQNKEEVEENLKLFNENTLLEATDGINANEESVVNLLLSHVSTRERMIDIDSFYVPINSYLDSSKKIIDIGCGIHPLLAHLKLPNKLSSFENYVAVDKDSTSIKIVNSYAENMHQNILEAHEWDIASGWEDLYSKTSVPSYDFAFMMKLIPLLVRQNRDLINIIKDIPARYLLITGSKTSMTKKISIEKRERAIISDFIHASGWKRIQELEMSEEFGWVVETNYKG